MNVDVTIDRFVCIGSGTCVRLAPGAFELDDEGVAVLVNPLTADLSELQQAERACPTAAIVVGSGQYEGGRAA